MTLLAGKTIGELLGGNPATSNFLNAAGRSNGYNYRLADVEHLETAQAAPMNGNFKCIEISWNVPAAWNMDGIQITQDRDQDSGSRLWKGWLAKAIGFSSVLDDY